MNQKCVLKEINNCDEYDDEITRTSQKCISCKDGYYLNNNLCKKGALSNCLKYQDGSSDICLKCKDGYAHIDGDNSYCFKIDSRLKCNSVNLN